MIKKEHIKNTLWGIVILTNIVFWANVYVDIKLKTQRLVYQVNHVVITDTRINKEKNKYLYADTEISLLNIVTGVKVSNIYAKELSKVKTFKRFHCGSGDNLLEYSRQDENLFYPEEATVVYQTRIKIPRIALIKTYFSDTQYLVLDTSINDLPLPLNASYLTYKHMCGVFADWNVKI